MKPIKIINTVTKKGFILFGEVKSGFLICELTNNVKGEGQHFDIIPHSHLLEEFIFNGWL